MHIPANSFYILKLRIFLRDYVDKLRYRLRPDRRKRKRVYDNSHFVRGETTSPPNAPRWTKSGYNGSMSEIITKAVSESTRPTGSQEIAQELALTNLNDEEESSETEEN